MGSGEYGVILRAISSNLFEVSLPGGVRTFPAADLETLPAEPLEALSQGSVGSVERFGLRLQALYLRHAYRFDDLSGLSNARIEPQLHQVYVAHLVTHKAAPRMILSDEVGLGKTIEAGLIMKELRARQLVNRTIVICPASLQLQWQQELKSKFNEHFTLIDGPAAKHFGRGGANPFSVHQNVICSHNFAIMQKRVEQIVDAGWDLVVFDEAHRVRRRLEGGRPRPTKAYELADELKDVADGLLLLTATPMQLHPFELWSHIELVEPGLYPSYAEYDRLRLDMPKLNEAMRGLQGWGRLSDLERQQFLEGRAASFVQELVDGSDLTAALDDVHERERIMDQLVDHHPLSRVMVRNRKANLEGFARRKAQRIPVESSQEELDLFEDITEYLRTGYNLARANKNNALGFLMVTYHKMLASSPAALYGSLNRRADKLTKQWRAIEEVKKRSIGRDALDVLRESPELSAELESLEDLALDPEKLEWEIQTVRRLVDKLGDLEADTKTDKLVETIFEILDRDPDEKILVFTTFIETQLHLAAVLEVNDVECAIFNGRLNLDDKEAAVQAFRRRVPVMISTEAGGEGRNFQFAHIMFNFDLPWNPMKVEQRIGRLDRIGQKRDVLIYNLYRTGTLEERVLEVLDTRIRLFEESVGTLDPILGEIETDLENLVRQHLDDLDRAFDRYETNDLERKLREARELEHTLGDFVMDRASLRTERAKQLIAARDPMAQSRDLEEFIERTVSHWGGTMTIGDEGDRVLTLPPVLAGKLGTRRDTHRGVFDPVNALRMEDRDFFAFGHELIDRVVRLPIDDDPVNACVQVRGDVPDGVWVEVLYEITTTGTFSRGELRRHLVGESLTVESSRLASLPEPGRPPTESHELPGWLSQAFEVSRARIAEELAERHAMVEAEDNEVRTDRLRRAERVFHHTREQIRRRIDDRERQIAELQGTGSERQQRIIPALRGRITADAERIRVLESSYDEKVAQVKEQKSETSYEVLAASVVVGT